MLELIDQPERIDAYPIDNPELRVSLDVIESEKIFCGGDEYKRLIVAEMDGQTSTFIERAYYETHALAWLAFRKAGIPVVPNLWADSNGMLLAPDIKKDGKKEIYGKGLLFVLENDLDRERPCRDIDAVFHEIVAANGMGDVEDRVMECVSLAMKNAILLPDDGCLELVADENGDWGVMSLDLRRSRWVDPKVATQRLNKNWRKANGEYGVEFLYTLQKLDESLFSGGRYFSIPWIDVGANTPAMAS